jgi:hypothetical protein
MHANWVAKDACGEQTQPPAGMHCCYANIAFSQAPKHSCCMYCVILVLQVLVLFCVMLNL